MIIAIVHGYLLKGTGSNLYVSNLSRTLCRLGHRVILFSQEPNPQDMDYISKSYLFGENNDDCRLIFERPAPYPGTCLHYRPNLGGLLPVYVYDHYPGYTVKEFPRLSEEELESYIENNRRALSAAMRQEKPDLLISQHTIMQPVYSARALAPGGGCRHLVTVHGSALNFSVRKSELLRRYALEAIEGADGLVFVSNHSCRDFLQFFSDIPHLSSKCRVIPAGVDTGIFQAVTGPEERDSLVKSLVADLGKAGAQGGPGKLACRRDEFYGELARRSSKEQIRELIDTARAGADIWATDSDAAQKIGSIDWSGEKIILYYGKYLWTKGVHLLVAAAPLVLARHPGCRFILTGFGSTRAYLETMVGLLDQGRVELFLEMLRNPVAFDPGGTGEPGFSGGFFEHLKSPQACSVYRETARHNLRERIIFTGIMDHAQLRKLIPCADLTVAPSIFKESFGMVAVEALSCGIMPIQTYHSGFADVVDIYEEEFKDIMEKASQRRLDLDENLILNLAENITGMLDYLEQAAAVEIKEIKGRAHRLAAGRFSWDTIAKEYLQQPPCAQL